MSKRYINAVFAENESAYFKKSKLEDEKETVLNSFRPACFQSLIRLTIPVNSGFSADLTFSSPCSAMRKSPSTWSLPDLVKVSTGENCSIGMSFF
jgi:hypothetical protein